MAETNTATATDLPAAEATKPSVTNGHGITEDEAALYDRQIRLWGVEAQNKMRASSVLLINLRGIAAEIAKNIVLAGVGSITLMDPASVSEADLGANFFLREDDVGKLRAEAAAPRIQALNPRVKLEVVTDAAKLEDEEFLSSFGIIVCTEVDAPALLKLNTLTRKLDKKLFAASSIGIDGWIFADLLSHEFIVDKVKTLAPGTTTVVPTLQTNEYAPFSSLLSHSFSKSTPRTVKRTTSALWACLNLFSAQVVNPDRPLTEDALVANASTFLPSVGVDPSLLPAAANTKIIRTANFEFPPSCAILGGIVGQDVLNALGGKEEPVRNFMVFEGDTGAGGVWQLGLP